ncbi:acyl-CoA dehydrogenase family protein [Mycolicibacterium litorale]|uniref:acyl-CoA dehydrogenase family protein n=1 Tax=Mycolicibacterium litorale TaxID=758802 RepID=UPI003CF4FA21
MTSPSRWWGPHLDDEQRGLQEMLDAFISSHDLVLSDDPAQVAGLVSAIADLGVWTLGTAEAAGGGGAGHATTTVALERLGRAWPALGWASVQAHAAVDCLAQDGRFNGLVAQLHAGAAGVAVVDADSVHVHLDIEGDTVRGSVDRVDAAAERPHLLVLTGDRAVLVEPAAMTRTPLHRTGFSGALTCAVDVDASGAEVHSMAGVNVAAARVRLRLGAAAVAAGIAGAAGDAAADYAASRHQFGAPLTALPTMRQSLIDQAGAAAVILGAVLAADGDAIQAAAVLQRACDTAIEVGAAALQSHGGYGYLAEYAAERRLRDAVSLRAATDTLGAQTTAARMLVGAVRGEA